MQERYLENEITKYNQFNLGFNIYAKPSVMKNESFSRWLMRSGCKVVLGDTDLVIYDRQSELTVTEPNNLFLWLYQQYLINKKGAKSAQSGTVADLQLTVTSSESSQYSPSL